MRFTAHSMPQRTPEWFALRLGRLTGSKADAAIASPLKSGGEPAVRRDYRLQLVAERLSGRGEATFTNEAMQWGTDHEDEARAVYEAKTGTLVRAVGFVSLDEVQAGCSPDGIVGDYDGLLSIKCPKTSTHLRYLREDRIPPDYMPQILCELWVTGAKWCDFMSYDPRLPENLQVFLAHYQRDDDAIAEFEGKALAFLAEVDTDEAALRGWYAMKGRV